MYIISRKRLVEFWLRYRDAEQPLKTWCAEAKKARLMRPRSERMDLIVEIKPIHTEQENEQALKEIEHLWEAEPGTPEGDRFEVLVTLVEAYEEEHYPIDPTDPIEAIKHYMESRGLNRKDLEPFIGSSGRVSEILSYRGPLSLSMIRKLNAGLGIPAEVLIREPKGTYTTDHQSKES